MCIRDRIWGRLNTKFGIIDAPIGRSLSRATKMSVRDDGKFARTHYSCLLYTSDAADERSSVDLGGRRILKKKENKS